MYRSVGFFLLTAHESQNKFVDNSCVNEGISFVLKTFLI